MQKFAVSAFVLAFCAAALAAPAPQQEIHLVRSVDENDGSGAFRYTAEQDNGQIISAAGGLKTVESPEGPREVVVISGQFSWVDPLGVTHWVNYIADENGFHPIVGTGPGGIQGGQDASIDPNALKSLIG